MNAWTNFSASETLNMFRSDVVDAFILCIHHKT